MIKKNFLFSQFYIFKELYCDDCNVKLQDTGMQLLSDPPLQVMKCPRCNKEYDIKITDL